MIGRLRDGRDLRFKCCIFRQTVNADRPVQVLVGFFVTFKPHRLVSTSAYNAKFAKIRLFCQLTARIATIHGSVNTSQNILLSGQYGTLFLPWLHCRQNDSHAPNLGRRLHSRRAGRFSPQR